MGPRLLIKSLYCIFMGFKETQTNGWFQLAIFNWELHCSLLNFFLDINVFLSTNCSLRDSLFPLPLLLLLLASGKNKKPANSTMAGYGRSFEGFLTGLCLPVFNLASLDLTNGHSTNIYQIFTLCLILLQVPGIQQSSHLGPCSHGTCIQLGSNVSSAVSSLPPKTAHPLPESSRQNLVPCYSHSWSRFLPAVSHPPRDRPLAN